MFGLISYKKLLEEKDVRIKKLEDEITYLRECLSPSSVSQSKILQEQNRILESSMNDVVPYTKEQISELLTNQMQANRMLMGDVIEV